MPTLVRRGPGQAYRLAGLLVGLGAATGATAVDRPPPPDTSRLSAPAAERELLVHREGFRPGHGAYALLVSPLRGWPPGFVWHRTPGEDVFVGPGGALHVSWSARSAGAVEEKGAAAIADMIRRRFSGTPEDRLARDPRGAAAPVPLRSALWSGAILEASVRDTTPPPLEGRPALRIQVAVLRDASREYVVSAWYWYSGALETLDRVDADRWDDLFRAAVAGFVPGTAAGGPAVPVPGPEQIRAVTAAAQAVVQGHRRGEWQLAPDPEPYERFEGDAALGKAPAADVVALHQQRVGYEAAALEFLVAYRALLERSARGAPASAGEWRRVWKGLEAVASSAAQLGGSAAFRWVGAGTTDAQLADDLARLRALMGAIRAPPEPDDEPPARTSGGRPAPGVAGLTSRKAP